jgi:hypothetical protein
MWVFETVEGVTELRVVIFLVTRERERVYLHQMCIDNKEFGGDEKNADF